MAPVPPRPVRIGLLGASAIAPTALLEPARRRDDVEVVAVASARAGAADAFAERWGVPRAVESYAALVQDPEVDAIYVSMAASEHARWSIAALESGKHVLCEKPAALSGEEAARMVAAASRTGLRLLEAFHYRHHPLATAVAGIVENLGPIRAMTSDIVGHRAFDPTSILHDPVVGGGALWHSGCYAVDWMRRLAAGEPRVVSASAVRGAAGADVRSVVDLRFSGGATGTITSSFERPRSADDGPELVVEATRGRLEVDGLVSPHAGHSLRLWADGEPFRQWTVAGRTSYDHQLETFVRTLDDPRIQAADGRDLVADVAVLEEAYRLMGR